MAEWNPARADEIGAVMLFLPQDLPPTAVALVQQLATVGDVQTIAGLTGEPRADAAVLRSVGWLAAQPDTRPTVEPATAHRVMHASDADDEVRCVVRLVTERLHDTSAHRVVVLYGTTEPYARLLSEHLATAGITSNGTGVRPTIERTLARALLDVLALPDTGGGATRYSRCSHRHRYATRMGVGYPPRAGTGSPVVGGDQWDTRLAAYAAQERDARTWQAA